jgi:DNA ligase (NAD+)
MFLGSTTGSHYYHRHRQCGYGATHLRIFSSLSPPTTTTAAASESTDDNNNNTQNEDDNVENQMYQELQALSEKLRQSDILYYNNPGGTDEMVLPDDYYDALAQREAAICEQYPHLKERLERESGLGLEATRLGRVGAPVIINDDDPRRRKQTHCQKLLSLDHLVNSDDFLSWLNRTRRKLIPSSKKTKKKTKTTTDTNESDDTTTTDERDTQNENVDDNNMNDNPNHTITQMTILTEPKLDGVSLNLRYSKVHNGTHYQLQWAATRGDGTQGLDVTYAATMIPSLPVEFPARGYEEYVISTPQSTRGLPDAIEIRGEVVLPKSVFRRLQQQQQQQNKKRMASSNNNKTSTTKSDSNSTTAKLLEFSNARNAASGILLRKEDSALQDSKELRAQLQFIAYDVSFEEGPGSMWFSDAISMRKCFVQMGFLVPEPIVITHLPIEKRRQDDDDMRNWGPFDIYDIIIYHEDLKLHRGELPSNNVYVWGDYEMDGCVHKVSEFSLREMLGRSSKVPRWAIAQKFLRITAVTELLDIEIQVGRTGALTPVALLNPVDLDGVTVRRATMHNFIHMRQILGDKDLIKKQSLVMVRRAGDVIPQLVGKVNVFDSDEKVMRLGDRHYISLLPPSKCPACGSKTEYDEVKKKKEAGASNTLSDANDPKKEGEKKIVPGAVLRCTGPALLCPPRAIAHLQNAFSRDALDISGLSEARCQQLMDAGLLRRPSDIFIIAADEKKQEEIAELKGWGKKSADNLAAAAKRVSRQGVSLSRFIYSLGIRYCGIQSSTLLAAIYGTAKDFLHDVYAAAKVVSKTTSVPEDLKKTFPRLKVDTAETKKIGPAIIGSLLEFAKEKSMVEEARLLESMIHVHDDPTRTQNTKGDTRSDAGPFEGLSVVFTGTIENMSREEAQSLARKMGARSTPSILTRSTDLLVEGAKGGSKVQRAEVRVMMSFHFFRILSHVFLDILSYSEEIRCGSD